jgi:4-hydroxy-3-polyprenylbenzoate decarboxylase
MKRLIVGISGASGVIYGIRLLEVLKSMGGVETHLVMSRYARLNIEIETDHTPQEVEALADEVHSYGNQAASISSGSFKTDGMVIAPCSMKTLSAIAHGYASNLIVRTAEIMLRMGRPLVLMPRETPLSLPAIENMRLAKLAGATILPPMVAYYPQPQTVDEITGFFVGKALDVLGIEHSLYRRWGELP